MPFTYEEFLEWRTPRFGKSNPERVESKVWRYLFRTRISAFEAEEIVNYKNEDKTDPTFCFDRYGQSRTYLPDGRRVYIAGEHEDYYDPDFCIYNDVVVVDTDDHLKIYNYPKEAFPPTDFHSATLVGDQIFLIGNLGYLDDRKPGYTQVYTLDLESLSIKKISATGPAPGWISRHTAYLNKEKTAIRVTSGEVWTSDGQIVENVHDWELELDTLEWSCVERRNWSIWRISWDEDDYVDLFAARAEVAMSDEEREEMRAEDIEFMKELEEELGELPPDFLDTLSPEFNDLERLHTLYGEDAYQKISEKGTERKEEDVHHENDDSYNTYYQEIDGVTVRCVENLDHIDVIVEGALDKEKLKPFLEKIVADVAHMFEAAVDYEKIY